MRNSIALTVCFVLLSFVSSAQQRAQFTKYMFNSMVFNPAYAGSKDHMSFSLIHRSQWVGFGGAPTSQSFTFHTPLRNEKVGVGLRVLNDKIGPTQNTEAYAAYAYRLPIGEKGKLSIGVQGGVDRFDANWSELRLEEENDPAFVDVNAQWFPNFGAGIYFYNPKFYVGVGVPHLIEYDYRRPDGGNTEQNSLVGRQYRHYYAMAGTAIPINGDNLVFRPSVFIKNVGLDASLRDEVDQKNIGAPTSVDIDLSLFFYKTFWVGAAYRTSIEAFQNTSSDDSIDIWAAYYLNNGMRVGIAYDYTLSAIQTATSGSFELMVGYEMNFEKDMIVTPRYF